MLDAINLLLENVLNGEYAQRLADIIYVTDFDFDEPIAVHIRHSKRFPVAGLIQAHTGIVYFVVHYVFFVYL